MAFPPCCLKKTNRARSLPSFLPVGPQLPLIPTNPFIHLCGKSARFLARRAAASFLLLLLFYTMLLWIRGVRFAARCHWIEMRQVSSWGRAGLGRKGKREREAEMFRAVDMCGGDRMGNWGNRVCECSRLGCGGS